MSGHEAMYGLCRCGARKRAYAASCRTCWETEAANERVARFWERVQKTDSCWLWQGHIATNGYGRLHWEGRQQPAHRIAWLLTRGPIGEGLVFDHLCRVVRCVNPDHLELVTQGENIRRSTPYRGRRKTAERCLRAGHPLTGRRGYGVQYCLTCNQERNRAYRAKQREKRVVAALGPSEGGTENG